MLPIAETRPYYWIGAWLALLAAALIFWPLIPVDETRYLSAAWDMWQSRDLLVPHLNGNPYSHKPPMLFWLINAGWLLQGVNDYWPRVVTALFSLGSLFLTRAMARLLWPDRPGVANLAPFILLGTLFWALFTPAVMFDLLLTFWVLVGLYGALLCTRKDTGNKLGWSLVGISIGLGVLTKGPVILLQVLLPLASAPWWMKGHDNNWRGWYGGVLYAVLLGAAIALLWAVPAAISGGPEFARAIFWGQTAGRVNEAFDHAKPWWWYLPLLPLLLFPWSLWPALWQANHRLIKGNLSDFGVRFCLAWFIPVLIAFSLVSGKQAHYLMPLIPAFALLSARGLDESGAESKRPWLIAGAVLLCSALWLSVSLFQVGVESTEWLAGLSPVNGLIVGAIAIVMLVLPQFKRGQASVVPFFLTSLIIGIVLSVGVISAAAPVYDLQPMADELATLENSNTEIAYIGGAYHGYFNFIGRLNSPLEEVAVGEASNWAETHPEGAMVMFYRQMVPGSAEPFYQSAFRGRNVGIWWGRDWLTGSPIAAGPESDPELITTRPATGEGEDSF